MAEMTDYELTAMIAELEAIDTPTVKKVATPEPAAPAQLAEPPVDGESKSSLTNSDLDTPVAAAPEVTTVTAVVAEVVTPKAEVVTPKAKVVELEISASKSTEATLLNRFVNLDEVKADVAINPSDLDSAMMEHASLYVHYATHTVNARRQFERMKSGFEILEATLDAEYRSMFAEEGKKVTETAIRNALIVDRRYSSGQARVIEAQSIWKLCEVAESALVQRKDLILEIARDRRKEREGQIRVMEDQAMRDRVMDMMGKKAA